jgi:hypothetical protein
MHQGRPINEAVNPRSDSLALVQWLTAFRRFVHECCECQREIVRVGNCVPIVRYGSRYLAQDAPTLSPRLVRMPVHVVAMRCPRSKSPRKSLVDQDSDRGKVAW